MPIGHAVLSVRWDGAGKKKTIEEYEERGREKWGTKAEETERDKLRERGWNTSKKLTQWEKKKWEQGDRERDKETKWKWK